MTSHSATKDLLQDLLSESVEAAGRRQRSAFDELAAPFENRLVLFGAGGLGRHALRGMREAGIEPLAFTDNNPALWGQMVDGVPVLSPSDAAARYGHEAAFVVTIWNGEASDRMADRVAQLRALGCEIVAPFAFLFWKFPEQCLPYSCLDSPAALLRCRDQVLAAYELLADDVSRSEYVNQVAFRLRLDFDRVRGRSCGDHYFSSGLFELSDREFLIDCGAFDGDTIRTFIARRGERFAGIVAFEPDPLNSARLESLVSDLSGGIGRKIRIERSAVGERTGTVHFNATGTVTSAVGEGSAVVSCVTLDEALDGCAPTLIKFDIEGSEPAALSGGARTITAHLPVLAVSAYHLQEHLWRIPLLIHSLSEKYRLFLRPEGSEGWDLVCYAVRNEG